MAATALSGQLPKYLGSTGGLLNSAETEEKYAITWSSPKEQVFELPTGGAWVPRFFCPPNRCRAPIAMA